MYALKPESKYFFDLMFSAVGTDARSPEVQMVLSRMTNKEAKAFLLFVYYVSARLFRYQAHMENAMRTPVTLFTGQFGPEVIPQEIQTRVPDLMLKSVS